MISSGLKSKTNSQMTESAISLTTVAPTIDDHLMPDSSSPLAAFCAWRKVNPPHLRVVRIPGRPHKPYSNQVQDRIDRPAPPSISQTDDMLTAQDRISWIRLTVDCSSLNR